MSEPFKVPVADQIRLNTPQLDLKYLSNCMMFQEKSKGEPVNFCQIMESSFDGIYITDGSAVTIFANHSYESITGLKRDNVLGRTMQDLVKNEVIDKSGTILALKNHSTVTLQQKFCTGKRAIITSTPSYGVDGKPVMVVTNVRGITELHDPKEQLAREKELTQKQLLEIELSHKQFFDNGSTVAVDPVMLDKLLMAAKVARVNTPVLLLGETGVGKEKIASYIHRNSPRRDERFIAINCGSISEQLAESELFGYEPGSFTGANTRGKLGLFEVADRGTLFLDEIGELPMDLQVKLLRVIQEQEVLRVGSTLPRKIDVRIIAATNQNLEDMVSQNRFRKDLFYRINVFPLYIPPLRERPKDILPLSHTILEEFNKQYGLEKEFTQYTEFELQNYSWPGNIRELRNIIERAIIISTGNEIFPEDLTLNTSRSRNSPAQSLQNGPVNLKQILEDKEAEYIRHAYKMYKNIRHAAACLAMNPATFLRKMKKYQK